VIRRLMDAAAEWLYRRLDSYLERRGREVARDLAREALRNSDRTYSREDAMEYVRRAGRERLPWPEVERELWIMLGPDVQFIEDIKRTYRAEGERKEGA